MSTIRGPAGIPDAAEDRMMDEAAEALVAAVRIICARRMPIRHQGDMSELDTAAAVLSASMQALFSTPEGKLIAHETEPMAFLLGTVLVTQTYGAFQVGPVAEAFASGIIAGAKAARAASPPETRQ